MTSFLLCCVAVITGLLVAVMAYNFRQYDAENSDLAPTAGGLAFLFILVTIFLAFTAGRLSA